MPCIPEPAIRVPREDILKYGFVLGPLAELAPDAAAPRDRPDDG